MQNQKTIITILFILIFGGFASTGFAQDDKGFIPGEDSGFYYTIKKGDTLWDLSQKFYNSQWDWPGLWEINDDIKNPHRIYPGKKIRIFLKEKEALKPKIVTAQKVKKVQKEVVPIKVETSFSFSAIDHIGFIRKKAHPSLGSVIKEEDDNIMMSANDIIYIKLSNKGTLIPGRIYHVFTTSNIEKKFNSQKFNGVKHLIKAQVKILDHKTDYVTALITHAYRAVYEGDLIMEYYKRESILTVEDHPDPIDARLICSEDNNVMINDYRIAFINIGEDKVKPGQIYSVRRKNAPRDYTYWQTKKESFIKLEDLESGKLIVLHTEDIASTVMILSSKYAIYPDDMAH